MSNIIYLHINETLPESARFLFELRILEAER